MVRRSG